MPTLTSEQESACGLRGGSTMVSAAAGSGKTTTLSERVVRRCLDDPDPTGIDELLLVTFTEKAALEMRVRIAEALSARALAGDARAAEQLERLPGAHVSTIHGFCLRLLREEWQASGWDPDAVLMDERTSEVLRRRVLDEVLERAYAADEGMADLVGYFGGMGEDEGLRLALLGALHFLETLPDPGAYLARERGRHLEPSALAEDLAQAARADLRQVAAAASLLEQAAALTLASEGRSPYALALEQEAAERRSAAARPYAGWAAHGRAAQAAAEFGTLKGNAADAHAPARQLREQAKRMLQAVAQGLAGVQEEELARRSERAAAVVRSFCDLLGELHRAYLARKREGQTLDFSDLEQEAYALLARGGVAGRMRGRFREVLVDEFQDVNPLQAAIVQELAGPPGPEGALFAVGDVKQSIYGFRHAEPRIFLRHEAEAAARGAALTLQQNFRSRPEIVAAVNHVFRRLMCEPGAPPYDERAELRAGRRPDTLPPDPDPVQFVELCGGGGDADELRGLEREADWIAREIVRLVAAGHAVHDPREGRLRPVRYGDCAVLLRKLRGSADVFDDVLALHGVPAAVQRAEGYLQGVEIQTLLALLRVVELPERDWDLLVTLRAPWFAASLADIGRLRLAAPQGSLYDGLRGAAAADGSWAAILARIEDWRAWQRALPLDRLLERLLADTRYAAHVAGLPRAARRRRDIEALLGAARAFTAQGAGGLGAFLASFERLQDQELDLAPPDIDAVDAVRVTSIHRSKGLEFPIVFVAGLGQRVAGGGRRERILWHRDLGVCAVAPGEEGRLRPTPAWQAVRSLQEEEARREEIRLLYVAMTRARDRLYLTSAELPEQARSTLDDARLRAARSPGEWLAAALAGQDAPVRRLRVASAERRDARPPGDPLEGADPPGFDGALAALRFSALPPGDVEPEPGPPLRLSASALGGGASPGAPPRRSQAGDPAAARASGIWTHRVLELLDLGHPPEDVAAAVRAMAAAGALPSGAVRSVEVAAVERFLRSELAGRIRRARRVERELQFSLVTDPEGHPDPQGRAVLQGRVDLLLEDEQGWLIVDFKTDHVAAEDARRAAEGYRGQLRAYRAALRAIAGVDARALLYFLRPGVAVSID